MFVIVAFLAAAVSPSMGTPDNFIAIAKSCTDLPTAGYKANYHGGSNTPAKFDRCFWPRMSPGNLASIVRSNVFFCIETCSAISISVTSNSTGNSTTSVCPGATYAVKASELRSS